MWGSGLRGLGREVGGMEFGVEGLGSGIWRLVSGFRVWTLRFGFGVCFKAQGLGFRFQGLGFRV